MIKIIHIDVSIVLDGGLSLWRKFLGERRKPKKPRKGILKFKFPKGWLPIITLN